MSSKQSHLLFFIIFGALFLGQFLFISPIGEFALNDDWVHTETIKHWTETGEFRLLPYAGPTFYVPILYGSALVKLFGFSFSLLRISTLALTFGLVGAFYFLLYRITKQSFLSAIGAIGLWLNPIVYNLSFTFMTDIPALFLLVLSLYFYYRGFEENKAQHLLWGSLFSVLGFFIRQTNIFLLAAAGFYSLTRIKTIGYKQVALHFGLPLLGGILVYTLLHSNDVLPQHTTSHTIETLPRLLGHMKWWTWYTFMYLGFFALPFAALWVGSHITTLKKWRFLLPIGLTILLALFIRQKFHLQFPYVDNVLTLYGLGPMKGTLRGALSSLFPSALWGILTLAIAGSAGWCLAILFKKNSDERPLGFLTLFFILSLLPILLFKSFDRYFLPLALILFIFLALRLQTEKISRFFGIIILALFALFSLTQTQFYLAWNAARWDLAESVIEKQERAANTLDAGYEWNGWHAYWSNVDAVSSTIPFDPTSSTPWWNQSLFPKNTQEYVISFSPLPGYDVLEEKRIEGYNPNESLFLLHKQ